ncbi:MAG: hypothetical protein AMS24_02715 [Chlamydiae bacterium SM23_39]|nr:MAG: hypothetical protein AMS24_02715 [Chlamydiae bacterium SM23_39]
MEKKRVLTIFMLSMINVAAICNIANLSFTAQHGFSSLFYYLFGAIVFFIPVGLISAELATGWPERGGVYIWVREALGEKLGFVSIWMQWIENIIWYPTILSFSAASIAYVINPQLAENKFYIMITILIIFWIFTFINFLGMKISGWISSLCVIIGIFIPVTILIVLGTIWILKGNPSNISFNLKTFIPEIKSINQFSVLAGILLILGGLEMSAVHAKEVENPQKNYPKAIFLSTIIILIILSLGALSIAVTIPLEKIELASGSIEAITHLLSYFKLFWAIKIVAILMITGALGMISTWIVGPTKGILATARHGELPPLLQKTNKKNMPISILIIQATIVTFLSSLFLYMPTVSATYRLLLHLAAQLYLIMYVLMFISAIVLRYKKADVKRSYKIPFGNVGIWIIGSLGLLSSIFAMIFGFFAPEGYEKPRFFIFFQITGVIILFILPIIMHASRKPHWHIHKNE